MIDSFYSFNLVHVYKERSGLVQYNVSSVCCGVWNLSPVYVTLSGPTSSDVHHEETDLNAFVAVIPKEGLAGWGQSFFWYDTDCKINL